MKTIQLLVAGAFLSIAFSAQAGDAKDGHKHQKTENMAADISAMADGVIKRVNKGTKKLTIKHGEIQSLEMPPMTMVFQVADEAMIDAVKKGDKIKFQVEDRNGKMVITEIKPSE